MLSFLPIKSWLGQTVNHTFYDFEYGVNLEDKSRHEFATVVVDRGYLYTLAASSSEQRWSKMQDIYKRVVSSFTFFI